MLVIPWLLHGTYDFILFVGEGSGSSIGILGFFGVIILIFVGLYYARTDAIAIQIATNYKSENIHDDIVTVGPNGQV